MKKLVSLKPRCPKCYLVKRSKSKGKVLYRYCTDPRHKAKQ